VVQLAILSVLWLVTFHTSVVLTVSVSVCVYIHTVARTNSCRNVVLRGSISYFLATRSLQMNVEVASDVDPKYSLILAPSLAYKSMWDRHCVGVYRYSNISVVAK